MVSHGLKRARHWRTPACDFSTSLPVQGCSLWRAGWIPSFVITNQRGTAGQACPPRQGNPPPPLLPFPSTSSPDAQTIGRAARWPRAPAAAALCTHLRAAAPAPPCPSWPAAGHQRGGDGDDDGRAYVWSLRGPGSETPATNQDNRMAAPLAAAACAGRAHTGWHGVQGT